MICNKTSEIQDTGRMQWFANSPIILSSKGYEEIHRRAAAEEKTFWTLVRSYAKRNKETKGEERREEESDPPTIDLSRNVLRSFLLACVRLCSQKLLCCGGKRSKAISVCLLVARSY